MLQVHYKLKYAKQSKVREKRRPKVRKQPFKVKLTKVERIPVDRLTRRPIVNKPEGLNKIKSKRKKVVPALDKAKSKQQS
ncbi:hypothetical protein, partial [Klebsiella pneumoniae]|uniref:hypothetical protein n=1 Tax=Klebsiella pneumoniae TaxID=573 RepID=UPI001C8F8220